MLREGRLTWVDKIIYILILAIALGMLYPFLYVFSLSISDLQAVFKGQVVLLPIQPHLETYRILFMSNNLLRAYGNSILYTTLGAVSSVVIAYLAGYPLSQARLAFRGQITVYMALTMFVAGGMIPYYLDSIRKWLASCHLP